MDRTAQLFLESMELMSKPVGVIVLEGPDGAGKTTLAEHICEKYDGLYVHRTWSKTMDVWEHHTEGLRIAHDNYKHRLVVIDRLYPSEMIYGRSLRNGGQYKGHNARSMERVLARMGAVMGLVIPHDIQYVVDTHARKFKAGLEHFPTVEDIAVRYVDWMEGSSDERYSELPGDLIEQQTRLGGYKALRNDYVHYDVTLHGKNMNLAAERFIDRLERRRDTQFVFALDNETPNVLGHKADGEYLFVGERVGDPAGWSRWPFYGKNRSSDFLNRTLHSLDFNESSGIWTNAWDEANLLPRIHGERPDLKVICFGREAERRCEQLRIPVHATVYHPSYAMRFNHYGPYADQLKEALS